MSTQTLKDSRSNTIGDIETRPDGTQVGKDAHNNVKGYYYPNTNDTNFLISNVQDIPPRCLKIPMITIPAISYKSVLCVA